MRILQGASKHVLRRDACEPAGRSTRGNMHEGVRPVVDVVGTGQQAYCIAGARRAVSQAQANSLVVLVRAAVAWAQRVDGCRLGIALLPLLQPCRPPRLLLPILLTLPLLLLLLRKQCLLVLLRAASLAASCAGRPAASRPRPPPCPRPLLQDGVCGACGHQSRVRPRPSSTRGWVRRLAAASGDWQQLGHPEPTHEQVPHHQPHCEARHHEAQQPPPCHRPRVRLHQAHAAGHLACAGGRQLAPPRPTAQLLHAADQ